MYHFHILKKVSLSGGQLLIFALVFSAGCLLREHVIWHLLFTLLVAASTSYFSLWLRTTGPVNRAQFEHKLSELQHLAYHDSLTGLPNRRQFIEKLHASSSNAKNRCPNFSVLFIDLDHFKKINDTYGHDAGDIVLIQSAERISACLPHDALLARLGGDEFVVLLESKLNHADTLSLKSAIKTSLATPIVMDNCTVELGASIGATSSCKEYRSVPQILRAADLSMYEDKQRNKGSIIVDYEESYGMQALA